MLDGISISIGQDGMSRVEAAERGISGNVARNVRCTYSAEAPREVLLLGSDLDTVLQKGAGRCGLRAMGRDVVAYVHYGRLVLDLVETFMMWIAVHEQICATRGHKYASEFRNVSDYICRWVSAMCPLPLQVYSVFSSASTVTTLHCQDVFGSWQS